jgi:hypothetical protein
MKNPTEEEIEIFGQVLAFAVMGMIKIAFRVAKVALVITGIIALVLLPFLVMLTL